MRHHTSHRLQTNVRPNSSDRNFLQKIREKYTSITYSPSGILADQTIVSFCGHVEWMRRSCGGEAQSAGVPSTRTAWVRSDDLVLFNSCYWWILHYVSYIERAETRKVFLAVFASQRAIFATRILLG
jgi:hypothetical protein